MQNRFQKRSNCVVVIKFLRNFYTAIKRRVHLLNLRLKIFRSKKLLCCRYCVLQNFYVYVFFIFSFQILRTLNLYGPEVLKLLPKHSLEEKLSQKT